MTPPFHSFLGGQDSAPTEDWGDKTLQLGVTQAVPHYHLNQIFPDRGSGQKVRHALSLDRIVKQDANQPTVGKNTGKRLAGWAERQPGQMTPAIQEQ